MWFNFFYASKIYALFTEVELYIVTVHVIHDDNDDKDEVHDDDDDDDKDEVHDDDDDKDDDIGSVES